MKTRFTRSRKELSSYRAVNPPKLISLRMVAQKYGTPIYYAEVESAILMAVSEVPGSVI